MISTTGTSHSEDLLINSWKQFIRNGKVNLRTIRPEILQSWQRCHKAGVDPYDGTSHLLLSKNELAELRAEHNELIDLSSR